MDGWIGKQTDRQTDRQTDTELPELSIHTVNLHSFNSSYISYVSRKEIKVRKPGAVLSGE